MGVDPDEDLIAEVDEEMGNQSASQIGHGHIEVDEDEEHTHLGQNFRDSIIGAMWTNYLSYHSR
jgi:hypothetical protein